MMTAHEKAIKIRNSFVDNAGLDEYQSKKAAIVFVNNLIDECKDIELNYGFGLIDDISWWNEIRKELFKL